MKNYDANKEAEMYYRLRISDLRKRIREIRDIAMNGMLGDNVYTKSSALSMICEKTSEVI